METIPPSSPDKKNFIMLSSSPKGTFSDHASDPPRQSTSNADMNPPTPAPLPLQLSHDQDVTMANLDEEEMGSDAEVMPVRLGPDGLKLAEDCITDIFDEDDEDEDTKICLLCQMRYEQGALSEKPPAFVKVSQQELIDHCLSEHPTAWHRLRQPAD
jgi:hypothetical protein